MQRNYRIRYYFPRFFISWSMFRGFHQISSIGFFGCRVSNRLWGRGNFVWKVKVRIRELNFWSILTLKVQKWRVWNSGRFRLNNWRCRWSNGRNKDWSLFTKYPQFNSTLGLVCCYLPPFFFYWVSLSLCLFNFRSLAL